MENVSLGPEEDSDGGTSIYPQHLPGSEGQGRECPQWALLIACLGETLLFKR